MADQLGRAAGGRWPGMPKALTVSCDGGSPLRRLDDLDSPGDGQIKSRTYRVTLADLTNTPPVAQNRTCSGPPGSSQ